MIPCWAARDLDGGFSTPARVPESENFDVARLGIHLVIEVMTRTA